VEAFTEALVEWQTFYFTAGGASATLVGLMFVAISLGLPLASTVTGNDIKTFASPSILHFVSVMLLAFAMIVPSYTATGMAVVLLLGGVPGLILGMRYVRMLFGAARRHQDFNPNDWLFQIILPSAGFILILLAAPAFAFEQWSLGFIALCLATVALMLCGIINTWAMVIWVVDEGKKSRS
jgi:hypothetical protein